MDRVSADVRSRIMAAIRGKNTKPELLVRRLLHRLGYRFRLHVRGLPGSPDLVLPRHRVAIFVHGCFWHRHRCRAGRTAPRTNAAFWQAKREGNQARDRRVIRSLRRAGWSVLVLWECQLRDIDALTERVESWMVEHSAVTSSLRRRRRPGGSSASRPRAASKGRAPSSARSG